MLQTTTKMQDKELKNLFKNSGKTVINSAIGWMVTFFFTCCVGLTVFYFNTTNVTANTTNEVKNIKKDMESHTLELKKHSDKMNKLEMVPVINQAQIGNIKQNIKRLEEHQFNIEEDIDEIKDILIRIESKQ